jgi:hypothetical protein
MANLLADLVGSEVTSKKGISAETLGKRAGKALLVFSGYKFFYAEGYDRHGNQILNKFVLNFTVLSWKSAHGAEPLETDSIVAHWCNVVADKFADSSKKGLVDTLARFNDINDATPFTITREMFTEDWFKARLGKVFKVDCTVIKPKAEKTSYYVNFDSFGINILSDLAGAEAFCVEKGITKYMDYFRHFVANYNAAVPEEDDDDVVSSTPAIAEDDDKF